MHTTTYLPVLLLQYRIWTTEKLFSEDSTENISVHLGAWRYKQVGGTEIKYFKL